MPTPSRGWGGNITAVETAMEEAVFQFVVRRI